MQIEKQFLVSQNLSAPCFTVERMQLLKLLFRKVESLPLDVFIGRHPPDRRLSGERASMGAVKDPFQHAHIFAEARPHEVSLGIFTEPVHVKNARRLAE